MKNCISLFLLHAYACSIIGVRCVPRRHGAELGTARPLHTATASLSGAGHPKITTHPSVVSRENDPRWEGEETINSLSVKMWSTQWIMFNIVRALTFWDLSAQYIYMYMYMGYVLWRALVAHQDSLGTRQSFNLMAR